MSYQGPSSKVSAIWWTRLEPLLTNAGPLGTQPTGIGVWSLVRAGRAGNVELHPARLETGAGTHPFERSVLSTCQRMRPYDTPIAAGRKLAASPSDPVREIEAAILRARPLPRAVTRW